MTRAALLVLAALAALALAAPATAQAAPARDPLRTLGGDSPLCANPKTATARERCQSSGAIEHAYPLDRYRFDWWIDTGVTKIDGNLASALQWIVSLAWQFVLWIAKTILFVFQWAFSLDLLGDAMTPIRETLTRLHTVVFGRPWFIAAISLLGLWGLWNGIARRRTIQTAGSLALAIVMMAAALALIARPAETIGAATKAVNATKLGILAGATSGTVSGADRTLEDTSEEIFATIVLRPWCAVQFGDVDWCLAKTPGDTVSHADRWLRFAPGSDEREAEYKALADEDYEPGKSKVLFCDFCSEDDQAEKQQFADGYLDRITDDDRSKVEMQEKSNTLFRAGLVALVLVGVFGWAVLIGWLAVQSLFQALLGFVLLLAAPVMLLAPAFGERGRQTFTKWGTRLLATIVSGAVYALLLAIVLTVASVIGQLNFSATWLAAWLLQIVFLWGVFFKRKDMLAWLSGNTIEHAKNSTRFSELQAKRKTIQQAAAPALAVAGAPAAVVGAAARNTRTVSAGRRDDTTRAVQELAQDELAQRGRQQLQTKYQAYHARLTTHDEAARKLPEMRRRRDALDRKLDNPKLDDDKRKKLKKEKGKLTGQIQALEPKLMPRAEEGVARKFIESADRHLVENGERFTDQQVALAVDGIRHDLTTATDPGSNEHAWRMQAYRPGIPESDLAKLLPAERIELTRRIDQDLDRDRALFAALPDDPRQDQPTRSGRRAAKAELAHEPLKVAKLEHRAQRLAQDDDQAPLHNIRARTSDARARRVRRRTPPPVPPPPSVK